MNVVSLVSIFFFAVSIAACGNGGSESSNGSPSNLAVPERTVYRADQDIAGVSEIYLVGSSIKLNPPLPKGRNVIDFQITPDRTAVIYMADQDTDEVNELYRVEFATPGVSTKLNSPLPVGGDVWEYRITPDSTSVLYLADQTKEGILELYRVPFATPGASTKLNGPLVAGGNVFFSIGVTPDNSAVVYRAIERTANTIELYRVPLATPGVSTILNGVLPPNADVGSFQIAPNGTSVVYVDSERVSNTVPPFVDVRMDLHRVPFATPGQSTKLTGPLDPSIPSFLVFIFRYDITPDSSSVVYLLADGANDERFLFRVLFTTPGQSTKLSEFISDYAIRPDSSGVIYGFPYSPGGGGTPNDPALELYLVPFTTPGAGTKLSSPLAAGGLVHSFAIAPDNSAVVYLASEFNEVRELYRVPFGTPGVSTKLNGPLVPGGSVPFLYRITPDSSAVVYVAKQDSTQTNELYRVPFATPGVSSKLNGPLTSGGNVENVIVR